jgi:hypothetical protein
VPLFVALLVVVSVASEVNGVPLPAYRQVLLIRPSRDEPVAGRAGKRPR